MNKDMGEPSTEIAEARILCEALMAAIEGLERTREAKPLAEPIVEIKAIAKQSIELLEQLERKLKRGD
jgi:hypothetical protein